MNKILLLLSCLYLSSNASAEIYKWVDDQGVTHYGDRPADEADSLEVDVSKKGHMESSADRAEKRQRLLNAMQEDRLREQQEADKQREQQQHAQRRCIYAKDRLKQYERAGYLYRLDKDGNRVVTSTEKREQMTEQLRKDIRKNCS
ncbi:MAG TPA: DUF4124 domain-containing protein [Gammaproteobacteria bacterium]